MKEQQSRSKRREHARERKKNSGSGLNAQKSAQEGHSDTRKVYRKREKEKQKKDPRNKDNTKPSSYQKRDRNGTAKS